LALIILPTAAPSVQATCLEYVLFAGQKLGV